MLEVTQWFTTSELVALRKTESKIELKTVKMPYLHLGRQYAHGFRAQPFDCIHHVALWRQGVVYLRVVDDFPPLFPSLVRAFPTPSFGALEKLLVTSNGQQPMELSPVTWRQILVNCPRLHRVSMEVKPSTTSPMTEEAWIAPLRASAVHSRPHWLMFEIVGMLAPPSVYLAVANPEMEHLGFYVSLTNNQPPVGPPSPEWTIAQLEELVRKTTSDDGKIAPMQKLMMGWNLRLDDGDAVAAILLAAYPNLAQLPWPPHKSLRLSSDTMRRMYATWEFITIVPPPLNYTKRAGDKMEIGQTRSPLALLAARGTHALFADWTMADYEKLLLSSTHWRLIDMLRLYTPAGTRPLWPSLDSKVLFHVVDTCAALERMDIRFPCAIEERHLQAMLACPRLWSVALGPPDGVSARLVASKDVKMETLRELFSKLIRSRPLNTPAKTVLALCSSVMNHFSSYEWSDLIVWWRDVLQRPTNASFMAVLFPLERGLVLHSGVGNLVSVSSHVDGYRLQFGPTAGTAWPTA